MCNIVDKSLFKEYFGAYLWIQRVTIYQGSYFNMLFLYVHKIYKEWQKQDIVDVWVIDLMSTFKKWQV